MPRLRTLFLLTIVLLAGCTTGIDGQSVQPNAETETPIDSHENATTDATDPDETEGGGDARAANDTVGVDGTFEVHAIDVGQGDATLVVGPTNETMLIDTGDWRDDGETVLTYLEGLGVERIDYLVTTHTHADHIGGHEAVIDHYETEAAGIGAVYDPGVAHTTATYERYLDAVERHDVTLFRTQEGDEIPMEGVAITVLNPPADPDSDDLDRNSLALRIAFGNVSLLFTGDADSVAERRMVADHGENLSATVLHAGHHGSNTSSDETFLDAVDPAVVIVSSAYDSQYGHPHEESLDRFAERSIATVWTGVHGTIVFASDGERVRVETQVEGPTDPERLESANPADVEPTAPTEARFVVDNVTAGMAPTVHAEVRRARA